MDKNYDDIINMKRPVSKKHPPMSMESRAAQFAPFAALTGYEEAIDETARITDSKAELDEDKKNLLDTKIRIIRENIADRLEITVTHFVADELKSGGRYCEKKGIIRKINDLDNSIVFEDGTIIASDNIMDITGVNYE